MTKRSVFVATGVALAVVLSSFALVTFTGDAVAGPTDALVPPAGELVVAGVALALVFVVSFLLTYLYQRGQRRRSRP